MSVTPATELMYLKGVGPRRAEILAKRGLRTFEDLLGYLPFRYEDRIRFAKIREIVPGKVYTIRAQVLSGSLVRYTRARGGMYHLLVRDETGSLPCKFFHGQYLEKTFKPGQGLVLHGKAELDAMRPGRIEMINPAYELLGDGDADSTEVGRIVPIYEAIGGIGSRTMRRIVYLALEKFSGALPDPLPAEILARYKFPSRREAIQFVHFPPATESVEALNSFRSPAHLRLIFEEFFFYQLSVAMRKKSAQQQAGIAFRVREPAIREAIKRVLPFKPTDAQKRALAEIAADLERGVPMNRLLQGDVGQREDHRGARSRYDRHRKRLPGRAHGADRNSRRAAFSGRGENIRAGGLSRGIADQRIESIGEKSCARARALGRSATRRGHARAA